MAAERDVVDDGEVADLVALPSSAAPAQGTRARCQQLWPTVHKRVLGRTGATVERVHEREEAAVLEPQAVCSRRPDRNNMIYRLCVATVTVTATAAVSLSLATRGDVGAGPWSSPASRSAHACTCRLMGRYCTSSSFLAMDARNACAPGKVKCLHPQRPWPHPYAVSWLIRPRTHACVAMTDPCACFRAERTSRCAFSRCSRRASSASGSGRPAARASSSTLATTPIRTHTQCEQKHTVAVANMK
jgi:hypothetical protein